MFNNLLDSHVPDRKHTLISRLESIEQELIIKALACNTRKRKSITKGENGNTYRKAAFLLGISERTLYRKINYFLRPQPL